MNDLIERIEAASEDNADLFRAAATAVFGFVPDAMNRFLAAGAFTDAALTLVPEGFEWSLEYQAGHHVSSDVECMIAIAKLGDPCRDWESTSYTPALALSAAALKADAYLKETNNAD